MGVLSGTQHFPYSHLRSLELILVLYGGKQMIIVILMVCDPHVADPLRLQPAGQWHGAVPCCAHVSTVLNL
jgi:hypothetical protein